MAYSRGLFLTLESNYSQHIKVLTVSNMSGLSGGLLSPSAEGSPLASGLYPDKINITLDTSIHIQVHDSLLKRGMK